MTFSYGSDDYRSYLFEYPHDGSVWGIEIIARNATDARARARAIATAELKGPILFTVPAELGVIARLACYLKNRFTRLTVNLSRTS